MNRGDNHNACGCVFNLASNTSFSFTLHCLMLKNCLSELRSENSRLEQWLREDPLRHLRALEDACHEIAKETERSLQGHL